MATIRETEALVERAATTVAAPLTLGFADCVALLLSLILMLISAIAPSRANRE